MFYRLNQLYHALFAKVYPKEYTWLSEILTPQELILFGQQTLTEQRHALDVAYDIQKDQERIAKTFGGNTYQDLLHAALLHDCGKSLHPLKLWQRIFIVIAGSLPLPWQNKIVSDKNIFGKTLIIHQQHSAWGKHLAAKAGVKEAIQVLIQNHHTPHGTLEELLYQADNRH